MKGTEKNYYHFVKQLVISEGIKRVSTFAIISGLSRRMIYYYLDELNYYLKSHNASTYIQGEALTVKQKQLCQELICKEEKKDEERIFSVEERQIIMFYHILFETERITIGFFESLFLISKNTVLKDLMALRELVEEFDVELDVSKKRGYFFEIDEFERRRLTYTYFHLLSTPKYNSVAPYIMSKIKEAQAMWNQKNRDDIINMLHNTRSILLKNIAEDNALILAQTLLALELRVEFIDEIQVPKRLEKIVIERVEFEAATLFAEQLKKIIQREITRSETILIGMYLLCVEKDIDQHYLAPHFKNHYEISCQFIRLFQAKYGVSFYHSEAVLKNVQTYMKVAYYRHVLHMYIPNKSYRIVLSRYPKVFQIIERLIIDITNTMPIFTTYFPCGFTKDMISDLTVIFEDAILREQTRSYNVPAIIVSDSSKVERSLIQSHITQHLPMIEVIQSFSSKEGRSFTLPIELCISTLDDYEHPVGKTIHIHSIPTENDIQKIQQLQFEFFHLRKRRSKIKHLLEELNKTNDIETTLNEIEYVYMGRNKMQANRKEQMLCEYLHDKKHLTYTQSKETLESIIEKSCKKMCARNSITEAYKEELLSKVKNTTIYRKQNTLIICGDYRNGARQVDVQINYLAEPILYQENEIREVYILVSTENMRQVPLIFEIEDRI